MYTYCVFNNSWPPWCLKLVSALSVLIDKKTLICFPSPPSIFYTSILFYLCGLLTPNTSFIKTHSFFKCIVIIFQTRQGCPLLPTDVTLLFGCLKHALTPDVIVVLSVRRVAWVLFPVASCLAACHWKQHDFAWESAREVCFLWSKCTKNKKKLNGNEHGTSEWRLPSCACVSCVFTLSYFILLTSDYLALIGIFHSSNELYSRPDFELGMGSLGLAK